MGECRDYSAAPGVHSVLMPSPVGHALAGIAAGYLVAAPSVKLGADAGLLAALKRVRIPREVWVFGALGMLPDADFLIGLHSMYTHSLGAIAVVGALGGLAVTGQAAVSRLRYGFGVAAAYGSHILLDWLGTDDTAPFGIMALWPASAEFFLSDRQWFFSVCRQYDEVACWWHNIQGVTWELLVLAPLAIGAMFLATRR